MKQQKSVVNKSIFKGLADRREIVGNQNHIAYKLTVFSLGNPAN